MIVIEIKILLFVICLTKNLMIMVNLTIIIIYIIYIMKNINTLMILRNDTKVSKSLENFKFFGFSDEIVILIHMKS